jgi:kynureninase
VIGELDPTSPGCCFVLVSIARRRSDIDAIEAAARSAGAHTLWGPVARRRRHPVNLAARDIGLAVGCTYKYLFGGPGAPAYLYVAPRLQGRLRPPVQGLVRAAPTSSPSVGVRTRPGMRAG